jgi:hypothetical protein
MILPKASENLYPRSRENFKAILAHYFPRVPDEDIEKSIELLMKNKSLSLNQVEFGARFTIENEELLNKAEFSKLPSARIHYAVMSIFFSKEQWNTSGANMQRLEHFRELYRDSFFKKWPE